MRTLALRPVLAADVGMSLALLQVAAHHPMSVPLLALDLGLAHAVYGRDRLIDQVGSGVRDTLAPVANATTAASCLACVGHLSTHGHAEAVPMLLVLSAFYAQLKPNLGVAKPLLVGASWAYAIVALPGATTDVGELLYYGAMFASTSNVLDIKDTAEDRARDVRTVPVLFGARATYAISAATAASALYYHGCASAIDYALAAFAVFCGAAASSRR